MLQAIVQSHEPLAKSPIAFRDAFRNRPQYRHFQACDEIQALGHHQQSGFYIWAIGATSLPLSRLAFQVTCQKLGNILAIQARDADDLVQHDVSFLA